jgi:hypothetical protein
MKVMLMGASKLPVREISNVAVVLTLPVMWKLLYPIQYMILNNGAQNI